MAMSLADAFTKVLKKIVAANDKTQTELAKDSGVSQTTISLLNKGKTINPSLQSVSKIVGSLDKADFIDFMKGIRSDIEIDVVDLAGLHEVKAYNISGYSTLEEMFASDVKFTLKIPSNFFPSDFCVIQDGHSMEPEIPDGAAVGVKLLKNPEKEMRSGELYLCSLPRHNLVFRRVSVTENVQQFEFTPDNPQPKYKQLTFWAEEATKMILGSVTWVAVRKKHSF